MELYRNLGILSIFWLWICLIYMIHRWPGNRSMTYSAHAAATRSSIIYYFVVFSPHLLLLYLFASRWFVPTFQLPHIFTTLTLVAVLGELVALLVPTTGGKMTLIHDISSYIMFVLLVPLTLLISSSPKFALLTRALGLLAIAYMVTVWIIVLAKHSSRRNILIHQTIYGASFHAVLLLATFLR